jgi:DNA-binding XRE family transcriptional regulator
VTAAVALAAIPAPGPTPSSANPSQTDHDYLQRLGLRLRVLRTARRLSQDQVADRAGLDRTYVSRLERGHHNLTVLTLGRLAAALGAPTKELLP